MSFELCYSHCSTATCKTSYAYFRPPWRQVKHYKGFLNMQPLGLLCWALHWPPTSIILFQYHVLPLVCVTFRLTEPEILLSLCFCQVREPETVLFWFPMEWLLFPWQRLTVSTQSVIERRYIPHFFSSSYTENPWFNSICSRAIKINKQLIESITCIPLKPISLLYISVRKRAKTIVRLPWNSSTQNVRILRIQLVLHLMKSNKNMWLIYRCFCYVLFSGGVSQGCVL